MAKIILTAPHAYCRNGEDVNLHQCDPASEPAARGLAERLEALGHEVVLRLADENRMDVDMNRPEGRGTPFRNAIARQFSEADFVLDVHSYPPSEFHWGLDLTLLRLSFGPDNSDIVHGLAKQLLDEHLSIAVVDGRKPNDITAHAMESGVPAVLVEFSEHEMGESADRIVDAFAQALSNYLELQEGRSIRAFAPAIATED